MLLTRYQVQVAIMRSPINLDKLVCNEISQVALDVVVQDITAVDHVTHHRTGIDVIGQFRYSDPLADCMLGLLEHMFRILLRDRVAFSILPGTTVLPPALNIALGFDDDRYLILLSSIIQSSFSRDDGNILYLELGARLIGVGCGLAGRWYFLSVRHDGRQGVYVDLSLGSMTQGAEQRKARYLSALVVEQKRCCG